MRYVDIITFGANNKPSCCATALNECVYQDPKYLMIHQAASSLLLSSSLPFKFSKSKTFSIHFVCFTFLLNWL
jgi:hypothetical protein